MVLKAKPGEVMWNEAPEVSAQEDAHELMGFGREALDICREEIERASDPEEISHWREVKSIIIAELAEEGEMIEEPPDPDPNQFALLLS